MKNFTIPKVSINNDKTILVYFRFEGKTVRMKKGINSIPNFEERLKYAKALSDALLIKLQEGWSPFSEKMEMEMEMEKKSYNLSDALDFALIKKKDVLSEVSYKNYRNAMSFFLKCKF